MCLMELEVKSKGDEFNYEKDNMKIKFYIEGREMDEI